MFTQLTLQNDLNFRSSPYLQKVGVNLSPDFELAKGCCFLEKSCYGTLKNELI
jgi:hypothetical protein